MAAMSLEPPSVSVSRTVVEPQGEAAAPVLRLRLQKPKNERRVGWRADTVDNEHMGKKKSKCCCIYKKPTVFGESSSEDDEDCEHCFGHPEKRRKNKKKYHDHDHVHNNVGGEGEHEGNDDLGPTCAFEPKGGQTVQQSEPDPAANPEPSPAPEPPAGP